MSDDIVLGIDLGTTNSVVAVADEESVRVLTTADGESLIPSTVTFHPDGGVLVGAPARERRLLDAKNTVFSVKRLIGRPFDSEQVRRARSRFAFEFVESPSGGVLVKARRETYTLSEISAFVLREVREVAERSLGKKCRRAVITVPANFNDLQRAATKAAGRVAGLEVLRILNEPTAAALAYGYGRAANERVVVFDLGGGTFDVTVLDLAGEVFEVQATAGDTYLGGDDIDNLIAEQMAETFLATHRFDLRTDACAYERLRVAAEWMKCQLSSEPDVQVRVQELAYGAGGGALDLDYTLTARSLEAMATPLLGRAFDVCEDAMRIASIRPTQIDRVILVGGSTRIPLVRRMVEEYFGRKPLTNIDPDLVVAQGAAIQARSVSSARARSKIGRVVLKRIAPRPMVVVEEMGAAHVDMSRRGAAPTTSAPNSTGATSPRPTSRPAPSRVASSRAAAPPPPRLPRKAPVRPPPPPLKSATVTMALPSLEQSGLPPVIPQAVVVVRAPIVLSAAPAAQPVMDDDLPMLDLGFGDDFEDGPAVVPHVVQSAPPLPVSDVLPDAFDPGGFDPNAGFSPEFSSSGFGATADDGYQGESLDLDAFEPGPPPLLLDVTPLSLSVETVGGFCEVVIARNAAIPTEQSRAFSTGQDNQTEVVLRVCQGEGRRVEENQLLGEVRLTLDGDQPRGIPIEVTFQLDADGTLAVRAVDELTGRTQRATIERIGAIDEAETEAMANRIDEMYEQADSSNTVAE